MLYVHVCIVVLLILTFQTRVDASIQERRGNTTCSTRRCRNKMIEIKATLKPDVDPCTDFAEYVCGNYTTKIPTQFMRKALDEQNARTIGSILEKDDSSPLISSEDAAGRRNFQKLQDFYLSCMNETQIARLGRQPLLDEIKTIINLFPVKDSPFESLQNTTDLAASGRPLMNATSGIFPEAFAEALGHLHKLGLNSFVSLTTERQDSDSGTTFVLYAGGMGPISKPLYFVGTEPNESAIMYEEHGVAQTLHLLMGPDPPRVFLESGAPHLYVGDDEIPYVWYTTARDALTIERWLAEMVTERRSMSLHNVSNMTSNINLTLALQTALPDDVGLPSNNITLRGSVIDSLDKVLKDLEYFGSLPHQIQNYLVWMVVKQLIRRIDATYGRFLRPYNYLEQERWKYCVNVVDSTMGKMVAPFFAQQVSNKHETAADMVDSIRSHLAGAYERAVGIDNSTKAQGLRELNESLSFVGFYNVSITANSSAELEDFYRNLTIDRNDYFGNRKNYAIWYTANALRGQQGFVLGDEQDLLPQSSHVDQNIGRGKVQVTAGSLRPPLFHDDYPEYVNFGSKGAMIAQRYTQMLNLGESSCPQGNLDFSTCATSRACQQRYCYYTLNRIIDRDDSEYHRFPGELLANSVGLQLAFDVWKRRSHLDRNGTNRNPGLQGLEDYTPEQLFFISFGHSLCETRKRLCWRGRCDPQLTLRKFRINGSVANSKNFASAFNCAPTAIMNQTTKCDSFSREPYDVPEAERTVHIMYGMD